MPELPEVETIRRIVGPQIINKRINKVKIYHEKILANTDSLTFQKELTGGTFLSLDRRGKFLIFHLDSEKRMVLHLRMTGQVIIENYEEPLDKHTHLVISFDDGTELRYIDVRRFGRFWLEMEKENLDEISGLMKLGIEPNDEKLCGKYLEDGVTSPKMMIKEYLLDQRIVCGIGNIYADEILYVSGIFPGKKCKEITTEEWAKIAFSIPEIIAWGIEADRMTPEEYKKRKGKDYSNILGLRAYGRNGKPCRKCGSRMEKMTIKGRSSCYCPSCQEEQLKSREDLLEFGLSLPDTYQDTPFSDTNWVLVRHKKNKKAFLWTYVYEGSLRINVKVDPEWRDFWRNTYESVLPGYHQNKDHWNTIIVDGDVPAKELKRMIMESYDLTAPKKRVSKKSD
ncbi:MAG: DNA-formamidopyrimidine glycosylase [Eubacteriales bacterium]|nr:DNA-formamidopyrimidine glycosylase [Eubacteriales bacterium]